MFGGTILVPIFIGFDPNVALLCSGIGYAIYLLAVGGRMPSYLGSSGAFIAVVIAATAYPGEGANPNIAIALGGMIAAGVIYTLIGVCVVLAGSGWIEKLMPPVVVGTVVAVIGLYWRRSRSRRFRAAASKIIIGLITVVLVGVVAVHAGGFWRRIPILIGGASVYLLYALLTNGFGLGTPIDFAPMAAAAWLGLPNFWSPILRREL